MAKKQLLLLILVAAGLAVLLWWDNRSGDATRSQNAPIAAPEDRVVTPGFSEDAAPNAALPSLPPNEGQLTNVATPDKESLTDMVERPLFAPSRRRPPARIAVEIPTLPSAPVASPPAARPNYALLGVIRDGDRAIALLRSQGDGRNVRVETGDALAGWQITAVDGTSVTLKRGDAEAHEIRLSRQ